MRGRVGVDRCTTLIYSLNTPTPVYPCLPQSSVFLAVPVLCHLSQGILISSKAPTLSQYHLHFSPTNIVPSLPSKLSFRVEYPEHTKPSPTPTPALAKVTCLSPRETHKCNCLATISAKTSKFPHYLFFDTLCQKWIYLLLSQYLL